MSSGAWAGAGAADYARRAGGAARDGMRAGGAALAERYSRPFDPNAAALAVQNEVLPYERNYFRNAGVLTDSLGRLDRLWSAIRASGPADNDTVVKAREAAAMAATARWMYRSALARQESRGMHKREDYPRQDPAQRHHLTSGGLDEVWIASRPAPALPAEEAAA
jgi:succinate dehydrogenase/fumarate reductase flavoprotein subunit